VAVQVRMYCLNGVDIDRNSWIDKIKNNNFEWESFMEQLGKTHRG